MLDMADTVDFFLVIGLIILIGFFGRLLRHKTNIPESLFLIVLGIILGPVTHFFDASLLLGFVPILSVFALVVILLEASTSLEIFSLVKSVPRSLIFTLLVAILIAFGIAAPLHFLLGYSPEAAIILGLISSGTTTVTVTALLDRLQASKPVKDLLTLESIINDFIGIVGTFLLLDFIQAQTADVTTALQTLFGDIFAAIVAGLIAALVWQHILVRFNVKKELSYMSTLGAAFVIYYLGYLTGANPIITVFAFGLFIGNMMTIADFARWKMNDFSSTLESIRNVQPDISFFVRTFFFVILGIIFNPSSISLSVLAVVVLVTVVALAARYASSTLLSHWDSFFIENRQLITIMIPRGFAATILAFVPQQYGINIPFLSDIVLLVVFLSTLVAIIGTGFYAHTNHNASKNGSNKTNNTSSKPGTSAKEKPDAVSLEFK